MVEVVSTAGMVARRDPNRLNDLEFIGRLLTCIAYGHMETALTEIACCPSSFRFDIRIALDQFSASRNSSDSPPPTTDLLDQRPSSHWPATPPYARCTWLVQPILKSRPGQ
jgi:hypothetical protein